MGELLLIRHSLTQANEQNLYYGKTDLPLSANGIALAKEISLSGVYKTRADCRYITSGMTRTNETLRLLFGDVPYTVDSDFREMDFGAFEMLSYEDLKDRQDFLQWISGDMESSRCPDGESPDEMTQRSMKAMQKVLALDSAVVITHGGVISAIMAGLFPEEDKNRFEWLPGPCRGYCIYTEGGAPLSYQGLLN